MVPDLREIVLDREQGFVTNFAKRFCLASECVVEFVQLRRRHYSVVGTDGLAQNNLGITDRIVRLVQRIVIILSKVAYNAVSSLSKDLIGGKHIVWIVGSGVGDPHNES